MKYVLAIVACVALLMSCNKSTAPALFPYCDSNLRFGFIDKDGNVVIEPRFQCVGYGPTDEEYSRKFVDNAVRFEETISASVFSEGRCAVKLDGKWGYINVEGELVVPADYDEAYAFSEGMAVVGKNDTFEYIELDGKRAILQLFSKAHGFSEGLAAVAILGTTKLGYIDKSGQFVIEQKYLQAGKFHEGIAGVCETSGDWISIDKDGKMAFTAAVIPYDGYGEGLFRTWDSRFIDRRGKERFKQASSIESYRPFSNGLVVIKKGGEYGYMDKSGKVAIEPVFEMADDFSEGLAAVKIHGKWGYIDKTGDIVISPEFRNAHPFVNGLAFVNNVVLSDRDNRQGEQGLTISSGYVNRHGKSILSIVTNM